MEPAPHRLRVCLALLGALSAIACAAHSTPRTGPGPLPFPEVHAPTSIAPARPDEFRWATPADLLRTALGLQGIPYAWGGDDPSTGFDCSGFVQYVLSRHRIPAPRTSGEQFLMGTRVDFKRIRAGDLVFFSTVAPGASHVGLAISADEFVHAPASNGVVRTDQVHSAYWRSRFVGARRLF